MQATTKPLRAAKTRLDLLAVAVLLACTMIWGVNQVVIKVVNSQMPPVMQAGLRSIGSAVLLCLWMNARGIPFTARDRTLWPGIAAGALFGLEFLLLYQALDLTTASRSAVLLYTAPFFVALGGHFLLPGDKLTVMKATGLGAAFLGILLAFWDNLAGSTRASLTGDLMSLSAAIAWAATTVLIKATRLSAIQPERTLLYQLIFSAVLLVPASLLLGEPALTWPGPMVLGGFAFTVVFVSFMSFAAWFWAIQNYPASRVASFTFLTPVFGVLAGALVLFEPVSPRLIAALGLIAIGITLVNRPPTIGWRRPKKA